ncbi:hypothetical protein [Aquisphaera giovannonii]|nr:hypothetical protein [Aquisphaera giovannonii]
MFLNTNQIAMVALGLLAQAVLGTNTVADGLACTPTTPASLSVLVGPGSIYSVANLEATAYGSLPADTTDQIVKQGIVLGNTTFNCPAPVTSGQSVVYLVQAQYQDTDGGSTVLPYYNASNPAVPYSGPSNSGNPQNTIRKGVCFLSLKTGVAATTGTQTTPTPDAGYVGLYAITVANGQTTVTSGNIKQLATAPIIGKKLVDMLTAIQQDTPNFALDTSGVANTITVALTPAPAALTDGMVVRVKVANSSTGATVMNVNGLGNVACKTTSGADFGTNTVVANGIYTFVYDANGNRLQLQGFTAAAATGLIPANNLSDVSSVSTSRTNLGLGTAAVKATSDNTKSTVAAVSGSITAGHIATFADSSGTVQDGGSPVFTKSYSTTGQAISLGGTLTLTHGLGAAPKFIMTSIVCTSAEAGYNVGDELIVSLGGPYSGTSVTATGGAMTVDATTINIKWSNGVAVFNSMLNKSTGAVVSLTESKWTLSVKAFA